MKFSDECAKWRNSCKGLKAQSRPLDVQGKAPRRGTRRECTPVGLVLMGYASRADRPRRADGAPFFVGLTLRTNAKKKRVHARGNIGYLFLHIFFFRIPSHSFFPISFTGPSFGPYRQFRFFYLFFLFILQV